MNGIETCLHRQGRFGTRTRTSQAGNLWASFSACVGGGDEAQWLRISAFGERAQQLAGHLKKGDRVYCEGRLKLETWTGNDGQQRTGIKVAAWRVERLGEIGKNKPAKPKAPPEGENPAPPSTRDWQRPSLADDAIPFEMEWR
jgi:single-strand DNA-binding protein